MNSTFSFMFLNTSETIPNVNHMKRENYMKKRVIGIFSLMVMLALLSVLPSVLADEDYSLNVETDQDLWMSYEITLADERLIDKLVMEENYSSLLRTYEEGGRVQWKVV